MINRLTKLFTGKEIILYDKHRQTEPLAQNAFNKSKFLFIDIGVLWRLIPFRSIDKRKHKIMFCLLTIIRPKYILTMNWISVRESLYKVWTAKHPESRFIVVQHGSYKGGIVTDIAHRYAKCDVFFVWGEYFKNVFEHYNKGKNVQIVSLGNPVYNTCNRNDFTYRKGITGKILLLPSASDELLLEHLYSLIHRLNELEFKVFVKTHNKQGRELNKDGSFKYPEIKNVEKITSDLYEVLRKNDFDFIISDHSTALLDAIFFKNKVIYFDSINGKNDQKTYYSCVLPNLYEQNYNNISKVDFYAFLDIPRQERLFSAMVSIGDNHIP